VSSDETRAGQRRAMTRDAADTTRQDRPRELPGPEVRFADRRRSRTHQRDGGRADLPVIGPDDSPRRVARRLA
jgi:hypothetical protein